MDKKKTALITGASKRIGKTLSLFLARKDWNIALHYNNSEKDALELKKEILNLTLNLINHQSVHFVKEDFLLLI